MAERHTAYHMLLEAFAEQGCPACRIVETNLLRYLDLLIHENVNDVDFRAELRQAGGFCTTHAWWLVDRVRGAALGTAIMYRDVLHTLGQRLATVTPGGGMLTGRRRRSLTSLGGQFGAARNRSACPLCLNREREEEAFLGTFASNCRDWRFMERYEMSDGLCFGHLERTIGKLRDDEALRVLLAAQTKIVERLLHELDEFQRKNDYRFHLEPFGAEVDSWQRAIELVNGRSGIR